VNDESIRRIMTAARVVTSAALIVQSIQFLIGSPTTLHWIIGGAEIVAAVLLIIPATLQPGAIALIAILAFAGVVHRNLTLIYPLLLVIVIAAARRARTT
jgi:hypothetical protein